MDELTVYLAKEIEKRRRFLKEQGNKITQAQLAHATNLSRGYINRVEHGNAPLSVADLDRIARALHTSASNLIKEAEDMRSKAEAARKKARSWRVPLFRTHK